jgi:iron complex outermembrane recepter protein
LAFALRRRVAPVVFMLVSMAAVSTVRAQAVEPAAAAASAPLPAASAASAPAASQQQITVTGYRSDRVVGASKTNERRLDTPQSLEVFTRQRIDDEGRGDLNDVLARSSSVGSSTSYDITIRGLRANPFSGNDFIRYDGLVGRPGGATQNISLATAERVEVLKGPNAILYGAGADGGVINVVSKQPLANPRHELAATVGSFGLVTGLVDLTGPLDADKSLRYRLVAEGTKDGTFRVNSDKRDALLAPSLEWVGANTSLLLSAEFRDSRESPPFWAIAGLAPGGRPTRYFRDKSFAAKDDFASNKGGAIGAKLTHQFDGGAELNAVLRFSKYKERYLAHYGVDLDADGRTLNRGFYDTEDDNKTLSASLYAVLPFELGAFGRHKLLLGADIKNEDRVQLSCFDCQDTLSTQIDILAPDYSLRTSATPSEFTPFDISNRLFRFYAQDTVRFGERWVALVGVAHDRFKGFETDGTADDGRYEDSKTTGRLGLVWKLTPQQSLYLSRSESFVPQSVFVNSLGGPFPPEEGTQWETGWQIESQDRRSSLSVALFHIRKKNIAEPVDLVSPPQIDAVRSRGLEVEGVAQLSRSWYAQAAYAYTDAKITGSDNPTRVGLRRSGSFRHKLSAWTRYDFASVPGLGFGVGLLRVAGVAASDSSATVPDFTVLDAAAYYKLGAVDLTLNVGNLTDEVYADSLSNGVFTYSSYGAPRSVKLTARWVF